MFKALLIASALLTLPSFKNFDALLPDLRPRHTNVNTTGRRITARLQTPLRIYRREHFSPSSRTQNLSEGLPSGGYFLGGAFRLDVNGAILATAVRG